MALFGVLHTLWRLARSGAVMPQLLGEMSKITMLLSGQRKVGEQ